MPKDKEESCGALWEKSGAKGTWFSGNIQLEGKDGPKIPIVVFRNTFKGENEKAPDYRILRAKPKGDREPGEDREPEHRTTRTPF